MTSIHTILTGGPPSLDLGLGSELDRVIGTGDSFPAFPGLIEYNGIVLNHNAAFDYFHVNSVDGVDDADVRDIRSPKPNDDGEDAYGAPYGGRTLVINGEIRTYDVWKADDMRSALQRAFALTSIEKPMIFKLGSPHKDKFVMCKKSAKTEIPWQQPTRDMPRVPYMVTLRASDPRFLSFLRQSYTKSGLGPFSLLNEGNYYANTSIRFTGPFEELTLTRYYEESVQIVRVGPVAAEEYIVVDGVSVTDHAGNNAYHLYSDDSDKLTLGPGPALNYLEVTGWMVTSPSSVIVQWRHSWVPM
jgi:hypothetical protein